MNAAALATPGVVPTSAADALALLSVRAQRSVHARMRTVVSTLSEEEAPEELAELCATVAGEVGADPQKLWLAYAVLGGRLPTYEDMDDALVAARLHGPWAALAPLVAACATTDRLPEIEVLRGKVTCDVHSTAQSTYLSGIQRVVRETASRWRRTQDVTFLAWTGGGTMLRELREDERWRLFGELGEASEASEAQEAPPRLVVPWECTHLCLEIIPPEASPQLIGLAEHSRNEVDFLGYDCIPITSTATAATGMATAFARSLAGARRAVRVAMISRAAAEEFQGVMEMGAGRRGRTPKVRAVPLPAEAREPSPEDLAEARAGLTIPGMPMVLVVGSHEPRKNHLAVLHAADRLWREGVTFNLVMVGAGAWKAEEYTLALTELTQATRPVQSIRALPDRLLWAAYRLAHCTVFPSLNEGFGLPVAESLVLGTPVITSDYGSMHDIVAPGGVPLGGLLVDPRDDTSLLKGMRTMLTDPAMHRRLKQETAHHAARTWDQYAAALWAFLVNGEEPDGS